MPSSSITPSRDDPRALLGEWHFARSVEDHLAGQRVRVDGTLTLSDAVGDGAPGARLRWSEVGVMRREEGDLEVHRLLFLVERQHGWDVVFDDGRPFHPWRVGAWVEHPCAADLYRGLVTVVDAQRWSVQWQVRGPAKDYLMTTHLSR